MASVRSWDSRPVSKERFIEVMEDNATAVSDAGSVVLVVDKNANPRVVLGNVIERLGWVPVTATADSGKFDGERTITWAPLTEVLE